MFYSNGPPGKWLPYTLIPSHAKFSLYSFHSTISGLSPGSCERVLSVPIDSSQPTVLKPEGDVANN